MEDLRSLVTEAKKKKPTRKKGKHLYIKINLANKLFGGDMNKVAKILRNVAGKIESGELTAKDDIKITYT